MAQELEARRSAAAPVPRDALGACVIALPFSRVCRFAEWTLLVVVAHSTKSKCRIEALLLQGSRHSPAPIRHARRMLCSAADPR
jgi:hypothetical protein